MGELSSRREHLRQLGLILLGALPLASEAFAQEASQEQQREGRRTQRECAAKGSQGTGNSCAKKSEVGNPRLEGVARTFGGGGY